MKKSSVRKLEYGKEYYERNRERILEARKLRWKNADEEQREKQREHCRDYYYRNKESSNRRAVQWMRDNKELVNARNRLTRYRKQGKTELAKREEKLIAELLAKKKDRTII